MKKLYDLTNLILLVLISNTVYTAYPKLPPRIPAHFNFAGNADRWDGKEGLIGLVAIAWGMTIIFYLLAHNMRRLNRKPQSLNIPHKEQFLKLPEEKQSTYWDLVKEFLVGLTVGTNLLWYLLIRGTLRIITGEMSVLSFETMLPALAVMILMLIVYLRRMYTLPGKLVRGEE
ncbi:MAG: DUF1648 domain-containing protein [Candidatus Aminicenantes bacterium]|nr:DUF1648 domain-containing protein [Candidatus Aminicenantes bacterium]